MAGLVCGVSEGPPLRDHPSGSARHSTHVCCMQGQEAKGCVPGCRSDPATSQVYLGVFWATVHQSMLHHLHCDPCVWQACSFVNWFEDNVCGMARKERESLLTCSHISYSDCVKSACTPFRASHIVPFFVFLFKSFRILNKQYLVKLFGKR